MLLAWLGFNLVENDGFLDVAKTGDRDASNGRALVLLSGQAHGHQTGDDGRQKSMPA